MTSSNKNTELKAAAAAFDDLNGTFMVKQDVKERSSSNSSKLQAKNASTHTGNGA